MATKEGGGAIENYDGVMVPQFQHTNNWPGLKFDGTATQRCRGFNLDTRQ